MKNDEKHGGLTSLWQSQQNLNQTTKMPAYNKRFGASGGVTPQKKPCVIDRLSPA